MYRMDFTKLFEMKNFEYGIQLSCAREKIVLIFKGYFKGFRNVKPERLQTLLEQLGNVKNAQTNLQFIYKKK